MARQAPLAVQASLASARAAVQRGPQAALADLMRDARALMKSQDAVEGMRSFVERREAVFKGE